MSQSPLEHSESLRIGSVEFVSPDQIKVLLEIDAPDSISLNTGTPRAFPRVNSYVLIPSDEGYLVGQIEWLTIERSNFPKRGGMKDFGLVDLPYPLRKMSLNPLGTLRKEVIDRNKGNNEKEKYSFKRGADTFPSVGDSVLIPTEKQLRSIVESGENQRVKIGNSPLAGNAEVRVDPDRLFGRHLAVLGNTGSGKSCSVAGLIRWSLEAAKRENDNPNARFIVLDPNGEYANAFANNDNESCNSRIFQIDPEPNNKKLNVPLWLWNSEEWTSFVKASGKTQRPTLIYALRAVRDGQTDFPESETHEMRRFLRTIVSTIHSEKNAGNPWGAFPKDKNFFEKIKAWKISLENTNIKFLENENRDLYLFYKKLEDLFNPRNIQYPTFTFNKPEIDELFELSKGAHNSFGGSDTDFLPIDADVPKPFNGDSLIRSLEASAEMLNVTEYVETMLMRIKSLLADSKMKSIISNEEEITLENWLENYIGGNEKENKNLIIVDLSLVPSEIIHIVTASIARIIFEALQRYRKLNPEGKVLPTTMVMEEAHTFVKRYKEDVENQDTASVCCQVFERIAREGRKFGLGLVLSSQRPSELSPTVLSQCNSFLLHRISNDRDQDLVQRFVPDNLKGLFRELPSLPSQNAILLGWAFELPTLVKINDLPENQRPQSEDPDFWDVWTRKKERKIDWKIIADDWQNLSKNNHKQSNNNEERK